MARANDALSGPHRLRIEHAQCDTRQPTKVRYLHELTPDPAAGVGTVRHTPCCLICACRDDARRRSAASRHLGKAIRQMSEPVSAEAER